MCLIVIGWKIHPEYPLILAANRDEFHARPTARAAAWPDMPGVFGGRDLQAGGTWLGITQGGRLAAITNVREPLKPGEKRSRGALTAGFLRSTHSPRAFSAGIDGEAYAGFNLLLADEDELVYCSNRDGPARALGPGIYGLSNHLLDSPWPKLLKARERFAAALQCLPDENAFFSLLADREIVPDAALPSTGVPIAWERLLSAVFVQSPDYGTRASTLVLRRHDGQQTLIEKSFNTEGQAVGTVRLQIAR